MRIAILLLTKSSHVSTALTQRLIEAGTYRGHQVEVILETDLLFIKKNDRVEVLHNDHPLAPFDAILVKPSFTEEPSLHTSTTALLKTAGYHLINDVPLLAVSKNKLTQRVTLMNTGIAMPEWAIARSTEQAERAAERLGFPLIIKVGFGTHGKGVFYADKKETFLPIVDYLLVRDKNPIIIERFVTEADRKDLRVFVVGDCVVAAMQRVAKADDVRANASIGGVGETVALTDEEKSTAIKATKAFDLEIAGVDILRSSSGPLVIEVNANPGFEELERATGIDVAGAIINYIVEK